MKSWKEEANAFRKQLRSPIKSSLSSKAISQEAMSSNLQITFPEAEPVQPMQPGNNTYNRAAALDQTIETEALEFLTSLDWRLYVNNSQPVTPPKFSSSTFQSREQAIAFCSNLGKNFTFLPMLWLNYISEWQLKAFFQYWLRLIRSKELDKSRVKLYTQELVIRFDRVEEMEALKES